MKKLHVHVTAATLIHAVICFYFHVSAECNMELISGKYIHAMRPYCLFGKHILLLVWKNIIIFENDSFKLIDR